MRTQDSVVFEAPLAHEVPGTQLNPPQQQVVRPGQLNPFVVEIFQDHGFHWGIFFPIPDPMHFQLATGT